MQDISKYQRVTFTCATQTWVIKLNSNWPVDLQNLQDLQMSKTFSA